MSIPFSEFTTRESLVALMLNSQHTSRKELIENSVAVLPVCRVVGVTPSSQTAPLYRCSLRPAESCLVHCLYQAGRIANTQEERDSHPWSRSLKVSPAQRERARSFRE